MSEALGHVGHLPGAVVLLHRPQHLLHPRHLPTCATHVACASKNHSTVTFLGTPTKESSDGSAGGNVCSNSGPTQLSSMVTTPPVSRNGYEKSYPVQ
jgi:hypothetical protein